MHLCLRCILNLHSPLYNLINRKKFKEEASICVLLFMVHCPLQLVQDRFLFLSFPSLSELCLTLLTDKPQLA